MQTRSSGSVQIFYPKFNREEVIREIRRGLGDLKEELPLLLVVLFGSYAKGNYTVASDVDLLVVYAGEERKGAYTTIMRIFDIPRLEVHVYSEEEYREVRGVIERMIRDGVVLFQRSEKEK